MFEQAQLHFLQGTSVFVSVCMHGFNLPINTYYTRRTHKSRLFFFFSSSFVPLNVPFYHSVVLLRLPTAMSGAVCGRRLPVVVKDQIIPRSAGPLSSSLLRIVLY